MHSPLAYPLSNGTVSGKILKPKGAALSQMTSNVVYHRVKEKTVQTNVNVKTVPKKRNHEMVISVGEAMTAVGTARQSATEANEAGWENALLIQKLIIPLAPILARYSSKLETVLDKLQVIETASVERIMFLLVPLSVEHDEFLQVDLQPYSRMSPVREEYVKLQTLGSRLKKHVQMLEEHLGSLDDEPAVVGRMVARLHSPMSCDEVAQAESE